MNPMANARPAGRRLSGRRLWIAALVIAGLAGLIAANAHFIHVAFSSQPECVEHLKSPGENGAYRAARSAC